MNDHSRLEPSGRPPLRVAVAGLGTIGLKVARALDAGIDGLALAAVAGRDAGKTAAQAATLMCKPVVLGSGTALADVADLVLDCAPSAGFAPLATSVVDAGKVLMTVNAGALVRHLDLVERAKSTGGRIIVPTGGLLGLDAVRAAAEGRIARVTMITRKPPGGLDGAPYLVERGISLAGLNAPRRVFEGNAAEGAKGFPANVNVAAALGLAGIGPHETRLEIWADPALDRNTHTIEVEADSARFTLRIENVPSEENPRTGKITALSVIACLRGLTSPLRVGT
jgi:aspartate dehydrogenase